MLISIRGLSLLEEKVEPKYSSFSGLRINISGMAATSKMPHSTFKGRPCSFNSEIAKCPCGQTFNFAPERDRGMKLQMHHRFCSKPPEGSRQIRTPKTAMKLREQQHHTAERMRKVYQNH